MRIGFLFICFGRDRIYKKALQSLRLCAPFCKYGRAIRSAAADSSYPSRSFTLIKKSCLNNTLATFKDISFNIDKIKCIFLFVNPK